MLTDGQPGRGVLGVLAVVVEQLELVFGSPVGQQRTGQTEQNRVGAVDAAEPHWKAGGLQHASHLQTEGGLLLGSTPAPS